MSDSDISRLAMPKWGMSMTEATMLTWLAAEGAEVTVGAAVAEVETEKINGVVECTADGVLRRHVAQPGEVIPVGGLLGVIADAAVPDAEIDTFIEAFQASFVPGEEDGAGGPQPQTIELGTRSIRYVKHGDGDEVVVLLHGYGGDLENWMFLQPALTSGRSVYALDFPGHGGSSKDVGGGGVDDFAELVAGFIETINADRVHLVGHSMGGAIASAVALRRPEGVASLTLVASAGLGQEISEEYVEGFRTAQSRRELKPVLEMLFSDPSLVTRQLAETVLRYKRLDGVDDALRAISEAMFAGGRQQRVLASELGGLSAPLLVIWGGDDRVIPAAHLEAAPAGAETVKLEGVGHSPHMEKAQDVARLIDAFIQKSSSGPSQQSSTN